MTTATTAGLSAGTYRLTNTENSTATTVTPTPGQSSRTLRRAVTGAGRRTAGAERLKGAAPPAGVERLVDPVSPAGAESPGDAAPPVGTESLAEVVPAAGAESPGDAAPAAGAEFPADACLPGEVGGGAAALGPWVPTVMIPVF
ncbi:hypothetical protein GCM10022224_051990 [Nonomuraea antimicrobica]|uniref:Uncharacterized protein n=1 Tax=Nonomuraea antimicrobica TaxID=561173 RepID=A0ABP7C697_9ACTN